MAAFSRCENPDGYERNYKGRKNGVSIRKRRPHGPCPATQTAQARGRRPSRRHNRHIRSAKQSAGKPAADLGRQCREFRAGTVVGREFPLQCCPRRFSARVYSWPIGAALSSFRRTFHSVGKRRRRGERSGRLNADSGQSAAKGPGSHVLLRDPRSSRQIRPLGTRFAAPMPPDRSRRPL